MVDDCGGKLQGNRVAMLERVQIRRQGCLRVRRTRAWNTTHLLAMIAHAVRRRWAGGQAGGGGGKASAHDRVAPVVCKNVTTTDGVGAC